MQEEEDHIEESENEDEGHDGLDHLQVISLKEIKEYDSHMERDDLHSDTDRLKMR